jgi:hypothetical protein
LNRKANEIGFQNYGHLMNKIFEADRKYNLFLKKALNFDYVQYQENCKTVHALGLLIKRQIEILKICKEMDALEQYVLTQLEYSRNFCLFSDKERQGLYISMMKRDVISVTLSACFKSPKYKRRFKKWCRN